MPVTLHPFNVETRPFSGWPALHRRGEDSDPARSFLGEAVKSDLGRNIDTVIQSSFPDGAIENGEPRVIARSNGFVQSVTHAYNAHHALEFRPDDVWLAIVTQFSFFVSAPGRAEVLRHQFVAHEGKKVLTLEATTMDFGVLAQSMTNLMHENVVDPELRDWIMPAFETTTDNDRVAASVIMMATLKNYFTYKMRMCCGIPKVTILGCKSDWESILARIAKLKEYGPETTAWYSLLHPILSRFVKAFEPGVADSKDNREFWKTVCHATGGSGPTWLSGWITAFCMFDEAGNWQGAELNHPSNIFQHSSKIIQSVTSSVRQKLPWTPSSDVTWARPRRGRSLFNHPQPRRTLILDGVWYPSVDNANVPPAYSEVPVTLDVAGHITETMMVAGVMGTKVVKDGEGDGDRLSPMVGWWIFTTKAAQEGEGRYE